MILQIFVACIWMALQLVACCMLSSLVCSLFMGLMNHVLNLHFECLDWLALHVE
jgi:flagellar biosynthesis protein FliQ